MTIKQAKRLYGTSGTIRLRKQYTKAIARGKVPNAPSHTRFPNVRTDIVKLTREQKILTRINQKLARMAA